MISATLSIDAGESTLSSITRRFPWVPADVVKLVVQDRLKPEQLPKLCNPASCIVHNTPKTKNLVFEGSSLAVTEEDDTQRSSAFLKAVPNLTTLAHIWAVYTTIRVYTSGNQELLVGLQKYLLHLIEYDGLYTWPAVINYHLMVCRLCFGSGIAVEWATPNQEAHSSVLSLFRKAAVTGQPSLSSSSSQWRDHGQGSSKSHPGLLSSKTGARGQGTPNNDPCRRFNAFVGCTGCPRPHACLNCGGSHPIATCTNFRSGKQPSAVKQGN